MSDKPPDRSQEGNRLSLRAVLVSDGEDPAAALAAAGIVDAVALPVVLGEEPTLPGGILGDGRTPNLIAELETEQDSSVGTTTRARAASARPPPASARPTGPAILPAAYGMQPLAPVKR